MRTLRSRKAWELGEQPSGWQEQLLRRGRSLVCPGDGGGKVQWGSEWAGLGRMAQTGRGGSRHWVLWGPWEEVRSENEQKSSDVHYAAAMKQLGDL